MITDSLQLQHVETTSSSSTSPSHRRSPHEPRPTRCLALALPTLATDLWARRHRRHHHPRRPILLLETRHGREVVGQCCARARAAGVHPGMDSTQARSRLADRNNSAFDPAVDRYRPEDDIVALDRLAVWAMRFTPIVAPDAEAQPGDRGLLLDITGCQRVHGGERALLHSVQEQCARLRINICCGIASSVGCAWAMARYASVEQAIVDPGMEEPTLDPLPVDALRLEPSSLDRLRELSIETIAQLRAISRSGAAQRLGPDVVHRLDQAMGRRAEPITPVRLIDPPRMSRIFDGPVKRIDAIEHATRELVEELAAALRTLERGVINLDVHFERIDTDNTSTSIRFSHPSRETRHIWALLAPRLEKLQLGYGVEAIDLVARRTALLHHGQHRFLPDGQSSGGARQRSLHDAIRHDRALGETVDLLRDRLGDEAVASAQLRDDHVPEHTSAFRPVHRRHSFTSGTHALAMMQQHDERGRGTATDTTQHLQDLLRRRPTMLLDAPEPIMPLTTRPGGMLASFRWREEDHEVVHAAGPERIMQPWWHEQWWRESGDTPTLWQRQEAQAELDGDGEDEEAWGGMIAASARTARDYSIIVTRRGLWLWIFRIPGSSHWAVHGAWI